MILNNLNWAVLASYKKAQELTFKTNKCLPDNEVYWCDIKGIPRAWFKSIWRHYIK